MGFLPYDKFGNPMFVRWLDDITIEEQSDSSGSYGLVKQSGNDHDGEFSLNLVGIQIDSLDLSDIIDDISGFSIVRAVRDRQILGQGLMMPTVINGTKTHPISSIRLDYDHWHQTNAHRPFTFLVDSPEMLFEQEGLGVADLGVGNLIEGDSIVPVSELDPLDGDPAGPGPTVAFERVGLDQQIYSKYYTHGRYSGNNGGIDAKIGLAINQGSVAYSSGITFDNNDIQTDAAHPDAPNRSGAGGMQSREARGNASTLFLLDEENFLNSVSGLNITDDTNDRKLLVNYKRTKSGLYGGTSDAAKANTLYMMCDHYQPINATVKADIVDGSGDHIFQGIEVWGGDCFVNIYSQVRSLFDDNYAQSYSWGVSFPCESGINTALRQGNTYPLVAMHNSATGIQFDGLGGTGRLDEDYIYNSAYSSDDNAFFYAALPNDFKFNNKFEYSARWSSQKFPGEIVDKFREFLTNNFKDADGNYGEINNTDPHGDRLFYWQHGAVGAFPVLEREVVGSPLGGATQLGVGGVMERADTLNDHYGNQHKWGLIKADGYWAWFDMNRRAFVRMTHSGGITDFGMIKGLAREFDTLFDTVESESSPTILDSDDPFNGAGIASGYDVRKKIGFMTFKFSETEGGNLITKDVTIALSANLDKFTGYWSHTPAIYMNFGGHLLSAKETREEIYGSKAYVVGDTVSEGDSIFVCILSFTSTAIPQVPSTDATHWLSVHDIDEIAVHWRGDICKFYGVVYEHYITMICNGFPDITKVFDNFENYGNDLQYTDVECETSNHSAADNDIVASNKDYGFEDESWWSSVPLITGGRRLRDKYMRVKLRVQNYAGVDVDISLNAVKRLVYLKTIFRQSK